MRLIVVFFRWLAIFLRPRWRFRRLCEIVRYFPIGKVTPVKFHVVTSVRNAGESVTRALDSVFKQKYDSNLVRHVLIDDCSTDDTGEIVKKWMDAHPGNRVEYIRRTERLGGCWNNLDGFRMAEPGTIVIELNGDDWLADKNVFKYLARVYKNPDVWITYNTFKFYYGNEKYRWCSTLKPLSKKAILENTIRTAPWTMSHLHTFRSELATYLTNESQIDPATGKCWALVGWDRAQYIPMLELAGAHSRHINRVLYVYNLSGESEFRDPEKKKEREAGAERIKILPKLSPLSKLVPNPNFRRPDVPKKS